jgi:acyl-CoA synthetase (AMP-forming)/AMP-acid ligase II
MSPVGREGNIVAALENQARTQPAFPALVEPKISGLRRTERSVTFSELFDHSTVLAKGLAQYGFAPGDRVAVFVPPSIESFALIFGLFRLGATPVMIDPGLGIRGMGHCLEQARPSGFLGIAKAQVARLLFGWGKSTIQRSVQVGPSVPWAGVGYKEIFRAGARERNADLPTAGYSGSHSSPAAILFTSGSTGPAKGVVYSHDHFFAQLRLLGNHFQLGPGEIDIPTFPLFGLFGPALGMREVIPVMDFTRPAQVDPTMLTDLVKNHKATSLFGSPALLRRLCSFAVPRGLRLETLGRIVSAGAPVPFDVVARVKTLLSSGADVHTPYGATEALPVASISGSEILGGTREGTEQGLGVCVGRPMSEMEVRILKISDEPMTTFGEKDLAWPREVGEIAVAGPVVTREYFGRPDLTALHKTIGPDGRMYHRMGDLGHVDGRGRLWMCGRKSQRVETAQGPLYTESVEGIFTGLEGVRRTALVGLGTAGSKKPVLWVEPEENIPWEGLLPRIRNRAQGHPMSARITTFLPEPAFPVDIRHNSKIQREVLAKRAGKLVP